ncbi:hypothetical protein ACFXG4_14160 [Nocardia sp. NPDC059246]|uniref:hypothetical protein n=1 Tax=unclassified Nocardia TaxID=2637762 RepID=UPI0036C2ABE2
MNSNLPVPPKETIADPNPVLAGHSYDGAMITVAGVVDTVIGLGYDSGYAIEEGESLGQLRVAVRAFVEGAHRVATAGRVSRPPRWRRRRHRRS